MITTLLGSLLLVGALCFGICFATFVTYDIISRRLSAVKSLAKKHYNGSHGIYSPSLMYANSPEEARKHANLHLKAKEHANVRKGESFYCNTFKGWRSFFYEHYYRKAEKADAKKTHRERKERQRKQLKQQRTHNALKNLRLESDMKANQKRYSR